MTSVLIRGHTEEGGGKVTTGAEMGLMQPQAKECLESPKAGRRKEWILR